VLAVVVMFAWILTAAAVVFDIFRSRDLSKWSKVAWMLVVIVVPLVGVIGYLLWDRVAPGRRARTEAPN
jgi:hypothetical protein